MSRRTPRFHAKDVTSNSVIISSAELHHLRNVLRLKRGDEVLVFTDSGKEYKAFFTDNATLQVVNELKPDRELITKVICASALPKGKRLEFMVQKLCELGLYRFIPVRCERSIVKTSQPKIIRLKRISLEATKQCSKTSITDIASEITFSELCSALKTFDYAYITSINADKLLIEHTLKLAECPTSILFIIGPEGGFTADEEKLAVNSGAIPVKLSRNTLRIETASIATMATIVQGLERLR